MKITNFVRTYLWLEVCLFGALCLIVLSGHAQSSNKMFRCDGNNFTNLQSDMVGKKCVPVEGNVVTVHGTKPAEVTPNKVASTSSSGSANKSRSQGGEEQRARDADSRGILEAELKKAEAKQVELLKEYNNGEPEKLGPETRNHQKYLDRVADLKAQIARNDSDIQGIKRELGRDSQALSPKSN